LAVFAGAWPAPAKGSLAALLVGAVVGEPMDQRDEHDRGQADLLGLRQLATSRYPCHVQQVVYQPRVVEHERHPVVRMGGIKPVAEDLGRDPAMRSKAVETGIEGQRDQLVHRSPMSPSAGRASMARCARSN
jgi:hypothetical protein